MAVNLQDYVNSDAKVKAARNKLETANKKLKDAQAALRGSQFASPDTVAEIKNTIQKAKSDYNTAKTDVTNAENAAENYFKNNYESISVASDKKSLEGAKKALAQARNPGDVARIKKEIAELEANIASPQPYKEPQKNIKDKKGAGGGVTGETPGGVGVTVDTINAQLAKLASPKEATNFISNTLDDAGRLLLAKTLKAAGYDVIETGTYNRGLVDAYQSALGDAQTENTFNKEVTGFKPYGTLTDYITYRTGLVNAAKGAETKTSIDITNLTDVDAAAYIETAFNNELKRKPTAQEIKALSPAVKAYVRSSATKTISSDGKTVRTSGPNPIDWLTQAIRGQQQVVGLNTKDKKQAAQAKAATKVLGKLSEELTTKQGQALGNFNQKIIDTVQSNGLSKVVGQSQIDAWAKRLQNGENEDAIKREIRNIAKIGMPDNIKSLMDAGNDLDTIYAPYKKAMATILEINPETISLDDSVLRSAIGPTGEMSIYDFQRQLRKDSRWERTDNARKEVSDNLLRVIKDFGYQG